MRTLILIMLSLTLIQGGWAFEVGGPRNESSEARNPKGSAQSAEILETVKTLAKQREIVLEDYNTDIELSTDGTPLIIEETTSSVTKILAITPVVKFSQNSLTIDCSYVRASFEGETISVGTYCRGETEATVDSVEAAGDDRHMFAYSKTADWLTKVRNKVRKVARCPHPGGMKYFSLYIVRCDSSESNATTDGVTIVILNESYRLITSVSGYEFSPQKADTMPKHAMFWGLRKNSSYHYEILQKDL